jgi:hypothetical protein
MPDIVAISSAATGLQAAGQILKALFGLKISAEVQAKISELQTIILAAQGDALAAQSDQLTLLQRVRDLEEEVATAKAWEAEKERYQLQEFPAGAFAYVLKADAAGSEPPHRICASCYQDGHKSILQTAARHSGGEMVHCMRCKTQLTLSDFQSRASAVRYNRERV